MWVSITVLLFWAQPFAFLFQAEDGIRDKLVTGVQTCALPISQRRRAGPVSASPGRDGGALGRGAAQPVRRCSTVGDAPVLVAVRRPRRAPRGALWGTARGRAGAGPPAGRPAPAGAHQRRAEAAHDPAGVGTGRSAAGLRREDPPRQHSAT